MGDLVLDSNANARWLQRLAGALSEKADYLTELDAAIGDADHGINMDRGFRAVRERVLVQAQGREPAAVWKQVGMTLLSTVGGAGGPLYGTLFLRMAQAADGTSSLDLRALRDALAGGLEGVRQRGKAEPGDKTMVDALLPAVEALDRALAAGEDPARAIAQAAEAAEAGARATIPLKALKGRASYLGHRSIGHQDPGATSSAILLRTLADTLAGP